MSHDEQAAPPTAEERHLNELGYKQQFDRTMGLWSNFALGFLYLSPLVGVVSLFALGLSTAGPPSIFWILIVGAGQLLVVLVFGEIVGQYPLAGGLYQWARRLWSGRYAWFITWIYVFAVMIGITSTALFSADFVAALFADTDALDTGATPGARLAIAFAVLAAGILLNASGTKALARVARIALAAELSGVVLVGLYLLLFQRHQPFSVFFDSMNAGGGQSYVGAFIGAALIGLFLMYGFEACGELAEEVRNPGRRIPFAMQMTVIVGGSAAFLSFAGYVLAAKDLQAIVSGEITNPVPAILLSSLGVGGTKIFLIVALMSFLAGVMGQQTAASRVVYSFARDRMCPGSRLFSTMRPGRNVPVNALLAVNVLPAILVVFVYFEPDSLFRIAAFQVVAVYVAFQMVIFASLRMRLRGWKPAGPFQLGRAGIPVSVVALIYGVGSIIILSRPTGTGPFYDRWIALIGFVVVAGTGLLYLLIAQPDARQDGPEGDAIEIAGRMRQNQRAHGPTTARRPG